MSRTSAPSAATPLGQEAAAEEEGRQRTEDPEERRHQACRPRVLAEQRERGRQQPVGEGRLLELRLAEQQGSQRARSRQHLPRGLGVEDLVGVRERQGVERQGDDEHGRRQQDQIDGRGVAWRRRREGRFVRRRHGGVLVASPAPTSRPARRRRRSPTFTARSSGITVSTRALFAGPSGGPVRRGLSGARSSVRRSGRRGRRDAFRAARPRPERRTTPRSRRVLRRPRE